MDSEATAPSTSRRDRRDRLKARQKVHNPRASLSKTAVLRPSEGDGRARGSRGDGPAGESRGEGPSVETVASAGNSGPSIQSALGEGPSIETAGSAANPGPSVETAGSAVNPGLPVETAGSAANPGASAMDMFRTVPLNGTFNVEIKDEESAADLGIAFVAGSGDIQDVQFGSLAHRHGVRSGDVLLTVNGVEVKVLIEAGDLNGVLSKPAQLSFVGGNSNRDRDLCVPRSAKSIGCGLATLPPDLVRIGLVKKGSWADRVGLVPDDEIRLVNYAFASAYDENGLQAALQVRPLNLRIRCAVVSERHYLLRDDDGDIGAKFSGAPPGPVKIEAVDAAAWTANSWATNTGLAVGDELLSVSGQEISDMHGGETELREALAQRPLTLRLRLAFVASAAIERVARHGGAWSTRPMSTTYAEQNAGRLGALHVSGAEATERTQTAAKVDPLPCNGAALPPSVAMHLLPLSHEFARGRPPLPSRVEPRTAGPQPEWKDTEFYLNSWEQTSRIIEESKLPIQTLRFSYEQICEQRLGPLAFVPEAAVTAQEFQQGLLSNCLHYQLQEQGVERSNAKPNYAGLVVPMPAADLRDAEVAQRFGSALKENASIREAMQRDAALMRRAIPKEAASREIVPASVSADGSRKDPRKEGVYDVAGRPSPFSYEEIILSVFVASATNLPQAAFLHGSDPYVVVCVLDGDPLSIESRCKGDEEAAKIWYSSREQFRARTDPIKETLNPVWNAVLNLRVKPRERYFVHFQLLDDEDIRATDIPIGQAAVPMGDVLQYKWVGARSIALVPYERLVQKKWADLAETRLVVSMSWEGAEGMSIPVEPPRPQFKKIDQETTSSAVHSRLEKRRMRQAAKS